MRPRGEIASALLQAASAPGTVKQLCQRAQVGYMAGQYTASRMLQRGELVPVDTAQGAGPGRPALVVQAAQGVPARHAHQAEMGPDCLVTWAFA
jgi:hypothetical protein